MCLFVITCSSEETETKITVLYFAVAIVLSVLTIIDLMTLSYPERFGYGPVLLADNLTEKPAKYIQLTNPDSYVQQAISDLGKAVLIGSWENTQFDEMVQTYGTNNAEISWFILGISIIIKRLRKK